jgi:hypothetical protein
MRNPSSAEDRLEQEVGSHHPTSFSEPWRAPLFKSPFSCLPDRGRLQFFRYRQYPPPTSRWFLNYTGAMSYRSPECSLKRVHPN